MTRATDLVLLGLVFALGWALVDYEPSLAATPDGLVPITAVIEATGDEPLRGLGLLLLPKDSLSLPASQASASGDDLAPHQISPWMADRTTQVRVPEPGLYCVRWALKDGHEPPRRPRDVMRELPPDAKLEDQVIAIERSRGKTLQVVQIALPRAHAKGLRELAGLQ